MAHKTWLSDVDTFVSRVGRRSTCISVNVSGSYCNNNERMIATLFLSMSANPGIVVLYLGVPAYII